MTYIFRRPKLPTAILCIWATSLLCLQTQAQFTPDNRRSQLSITINDDQINTLRENLLYVQAARKLNTASSIRRAYDATVTGWLDIGEAMADSYRLADAEQNADIKDAMLLPCLMVLSVDPNPDVGRIAGDQADRLSTLSRPQSVQVDLHLAVVKALQTLAKNHNSAYRIAAILCLRKDYPYAECPSLSLEDWLQLSQHTAGPVRSFAIRQLRNFPERAQELVATLMAMDDSYTKWDVCQTIAQLAPNRATIDWLKARILEGRSDPVEALVGLAIINSAARQAVSELLANSPSEFHLNSQLTTEQRDRLIVAIKLKLVRSLVTTNGFASDLVKNLGELLLWRAGEEVSLEHTQLKIATVQTMEEIGTAAIPFLQRAASAGVEESLIGLVCLDTKNSKSHADAIRTIVCSTDKEIVFDADRVIAFYKALGKSGPLDENRRLFLLERFRHHDEVTIVEAIVDILQHGDLKSAEAVTDELLERIEELEGAKAWGRLTAPQLIRMLGDGGMGALSAARLLKKVVESDNPAYAEAGGYSLIRLAVRCPAYRSSIADALQPAFKSENVANQLVLVLKRESCPMPEFNDILRLWFGKTQTARLKLNIAEACMAMGAYGVAAELLATAIGGGQFAGSNLAEAKELQAEIDLATHATTRERIDRAVRHLVANVESQDALEALSSLSAAASSALPLLEASLADVSDPYRTSQSALAILDISQAHPSAQATIHRLSHIPDLPTQSALRLAGLSGDSPAE
ncbi:MAG: hypothetical protein KDB22_08315 [Planctomycetales bacterium]|nr:hypothetical protein [Planctomycetales bacterium]